MNVNPQLGDDCGHRGQEMEKKKSFKLGQTKTLKDKSCQELRVNVLLAHSTNFQHTSLLKCSLKLKVHRLKAYEPLYRSSLMVKA